MPVEAEQYIIACERSYHDGFIAGQHKGMDTVIVGWAETHQKLCMALEAKDMTIEQMGKSLDAATQDLGAAIRKRDRAILIRDLFGFVALVLLVVLIASFVIGAR